MSQIYKAGVGSTPSVPTNFTTDNGSAVPVANNLNIFGDNGIVTEGSGDTVTVKFNENTNTTAGVATATIMTLTPADNDTMTYQILISGYDSTANIGVGGQIVGTVRKTAGVVTVLGTPDTIVNGDPVIDGSTFTLVASGGNVLVQATSASVNTVTWTAITAGQI